MKTGGNKLLFRLGEEFFCLDTRVVAKIIEGGRVFYLPLTPPSIAGVVNLKGELIPVIDPAYFLKIPRIDPTNCSSIIILGLPPRLIGLPLSGREKVSFIWKEELSDISSPLGPKREVRKERYIKGIATFKEHKAKILDWERLIEEIYSHDR